MCVCVCEREREREREKERERERERECVCVCIQLDSETGRQTHGLDLYLLLLLPICVLRTPTAAILYELLDLAADTGKECGRHFIARVIARHNLCCYPLPRPAVTKERRKSALRDNH